MFFLHRPEKAKESIIYSYTRNINGFAAMLDEKEAAEIASREYNIFSITLMALFCFVFLCFYPCCKQNLWQLGPIWQWLCIFTCRGSKSSISFPKPSKKTAHNTIMGFPWTWEQWKNDWLFSMESGEVWWRYNYWNPRHRWFLYSFLLQDWLLFLSRRVNKIWKCCMDVSSLANFFIQALEVDNDDYHMFCITALTWTYLTQ